jgi:hypothetical protein
MANVVTNPSEDQSIGSDNLLPASGNPTGQSLGTSAAPWNAVLNNLTVNGSDVVFTNYTAFDENISVADNVSVGDDLFVIGNSSLTGTLGVSGATALGTLTADATKLNSLNNIVWADEQTGFTDLGQQINYADSILGSNPGEIWVGVNPAITNIATAVTISASHTLRFWGGAFQVNISPTTQTVTAVTFGSGTSATLTITSNSGFSTGAAIVVTGLTSSAAPANGTWVIVSSMATTLVIKGSGFTAGGPFTGQSGSAVIAGAFCISDNASIIGMGRGSEQVVLGCGTGALSSVVTNADHSGAQQFMSVEGLSIDAQSNSPNVTNAVVWIDKVGQLSKVRDNQILVPVTASGQTNGGGIGIWLADAGSVLCEHNWTNGGVSSIGLGGILVTCTGNGSGGLYLNNHTENIGPSTNTVQTFGIKFAPSGAALMNNISLLCHAAEQLVADTGTRVYKAIWFDGAGVTMATVISPTYSNNAGNYGDMVTMSGATNVTVISANAFNCRFAVNDVTNSVTQAAPLAYYSQGKMNVEGYLSTGAAASVGSTFSVGSYVNAVGGYQDNGTPGVTHTSAGVGAMTLGGGIVTAFTQSSDERLKTVIGPYERGLDAILALNPKRYRWNDTAHEHADLDTTFETGGFIAQDVQKAIPEAVPGTEPSKDGKEQYLTFDDRPIIAALCNAIKELAAQVEKLKTNYQQGRHKPVWKVSAKRKT